MVQVNVIAGNIEQALKKLKQKLQREGVFRVLKTQRFFEKPSIKKKRREEEALSRRKKLSRKRYIESQL
ncbi:MAG: 30S ribosomal protein S21 [Rickettsiales bacterium]|nr:30S ribosomal protein S21 [Rickettsiales bacterium]